MKSILLLLCMLLALAPAAESWGGERSENKTISVLLPGKGIGNIALGDGMQEVFRKMGSKPTEGKTVKSGGKTETWMSYPEQGVTFIFDKKRKLTRIAVSNPGIILRKRNVRVNSSVKELEAEYGAVQPEALDRNYEQWSYSGISFVVSRGTSKIETIIIEKKKKD